MRIFSGTLKVKLLVLLNILYCLEAARRKEALVNIIGKREGTNDSTLCPMLKATRRAWLNLNNHYGQQERLVWISISVQPRTGSKNGKKVKLRNFEWISNLQLAEFCLLRQYWVTVNRIRTAVGRCSQFVHGWRPKDNPTRLRWNLSNNWTYYWGPHERRSQMNRKKKL